MKWDEVEREFFVIGSQLERLSKSFQALARALHRERSFRMLAVTKNMSVDETDKTKAGRAASQLDLF